MRAESTGSEERLIETVATFWAHYDDDLIFANPTVMHALDSGHHAHSFFFTAGDAGKGRSPYMDGRERGIRAAYDNMRGASGPWSDRSVVLDNGVTVTVTRPDGDDRVSLTFLRLPDGGLGGAGYEATGRHSLRRLLTGELSSISTLDTGQALTLDLLRSTVTELVLAHRATIVITHHPGPLGVASGDHPDHQSVGRIVAEAVDAGPIDAEVVQYAIGYLAAERPANLDPDVLDRKLEVFASYAAHDPVVARDEIQKYLEVRGFGEWLQRQYLVPHGELPKSDE